MYVFSGNLSLFRKFDEFTRRTSRRWMRSSLRWTTYVIGSQISKDQIETNLRSIWSTHKRMFWCLCSNAGMCPYNTGKVKGYNVELFYVSIKYKSLAAGKMAQNCKQKVVGWHSSTRPGLTESSQKHSNGGRCLSKVVGAIVYVCYWVFFSIGCKIQYFIRIRRGQQERLCSKINSTHVNEQNHAHFVLKNLVFLKLIYFFKNISYQPVVLSYPTCLSKGGCRPLEHPSKTILSSNNVIFRVRYFFLPHFLFQKHSIVCFLSFSSLLSLWRLSIGWCFVRVCV